MMRIITGKARGVRLSSLEGENTRPTAERVKEAVFSMLQFETEDREVLDLFAGSGQLGLECISRSSRHAVMVDRSRDAVEIIKKNAFKTKLAPECEIFCADWQDFLRSCRGRRRFDLIFLDPPYAEHLLPNVLKELIASRAMAEGATVVCESAGGEDVFLGEESLQTQFECIRQARYGAATVTLLRYRGEKQ